VPCTRQKAGSCGEETSDEQVGEMLFLCADTDIGPTLALQLADQEHKPANALSKRPV